MATFAFPIDAVSGSPSFTGEMARQALSALCGYAPSGRPLGATSGVRPGTPATTVTVTGSGPYSWNVANHSGVLDVEASATAGPYLYVVNSTQTGTITAADASNPRIDIVYVKLTDPAEGDAGTVGATVLYLAGTAAASPSAPATPTDSFLLATISVPKSGTGAPTATWAAPTLGDTGWVTSGVMQTGAVGTGTTGTVTGQAFRRIGNVVTCRVGVTIGGTTINAGSTGNIGNTKLAHISDSRFVPSTAPMNLSLMSNDAGPLAAWVVTSGGDVYLCAVPPSYSIVAGGGWTFGGSYLV